MSVRARQTRAEPAGFAGSEASQGGFGEAARSAGVAGRAGGCRGRSEPSQCRRRAEGPDPSGMKRDSPSPASLRSVTSPPVGRFGTCTPYPCPRGFAAPSPASLFGALETVCLGIPVGNPIVVNDAG